MPEVVVAGPTIPVVTPQRYSRLADDMILREAERIEARAVANGLAERNQVSCSTRDRIAA